MAHDPDDFRGLVYDVEIHVSSDWIVIPESQFGELVVDHNHKRRFFVVGVGEEAAAFQRGLHHVQIVRLDRVEEALLHFQLRRWFGLSFRPEGKFRIVGHRQRSHCQGNGSDSGNRTDGLVKLAIGGPDGSRRNAEWLGGGEVKAHHVARVKSGVGVPQSCQTPNHQSCPDEQH